MDDPERLKVFEEMIRQRKFEEAEPVLRQYLEEYPTSWRAYYQLGYILFEWHEIQGSIESLAKSLEINLNNGDAHKILGLNFVILGKGDLALRELDEAARLDPHSPEIHYHLGRIYYTRNVFPLAKREFEAAIRLDPNYMKAMDNLGLTLAAMGDEQGALAHYNKAIELNERQQLHSAWPYINLASYYNQKNSPDRALVYGQQGLRQDPHADQAHVEMAKAYRALGEWGKAAEGLEKAIAINPANPESYYIASQVYRKLGKLKESQQAMNDYQKLKSASGNFLMEQAVGRSLRQSGPITEGNDANSHKSQ